jgi:hypothetical protein
LLAGPRLGYVVNTFEQAVKAMIWTARKEKTKRIIRVSLNRNKASLES